jgi:integrase
VHRVLRKALQQAVRWQLISRNPCDAAEPPKVERREMRTPSDAELAWLFEVAQTTRLYPAVILGAATGMRRGEALAVRWPDLNPLTATVTINQSLEQTKKGLRFKPPKRDRSRRSLPLPPFAVAALLEHKAKQDEEKRLFGKDYNDQGLVCAEPDGRPMKPDTFSHNFIELARKAGLHGISFHKLRHGHATLLLKENVHPKVVQERLGHSSIAITLDLYSHVVPGIQEEAVGKFDNLMSNAIERRTKQPAN